jgi:hypothetical protein
MPKGVVAVGGFGIDMLFWEIGDGILEIHMCLAHG